MAPWVVITKQEIPERRSVKSAGYMYITEVIPWAPWSAGTNGRCCGAPGCGIPVPCWHLLHLLVWQIKMLVPFARAVTLLVRREELPDTCPRQYCIKQPAPLDMKNDWRRSRAREREAKHTTTSTGVTILTLLLLLTDRAQATQSSETDTLTTHRGYFKGECARKRGDYFTTGERHRAESDTNKPLNTLHAAGGRKQAKT